MVVAALLLSIPVFTTNPVKAGVPTLDGKKIYVVRLGMDESCLRPLTELLRGEGADVRVDQYRLAPDWILENYDVFIILVGCENPSHIFELVKGGKGLLAITCYSPGNPYLVAFAGATFDPPPSAEITSDWIVDHPINEGVRAISAFPIKLVSSTAYPLAVAEGKKYDRRENLILATADIAGKGRVVAVVIGPEWGLYGERFREWFMAHDNALFIKNAVYWLAKEEVPPFSRELPTLISLESKVNELSENITRLAQQLNEFRANLRNIPEFVSLERQLSELGGTLRDIQNELTRVRQENAALNRELSQIKTWMLLATVMSVVAVLVSAVALLRKARRGF